MLVTPTVYTDMTWGRIPSHTHPKDRLQRTKTGSNYYRTCGELAVHRFLQNYRCQETEALRMRLCVMMCFMNEIGGLSRI